ncbi:GNAT family N-acetyltransferase [Planotetraspora kaengkrachanensis]|uniref:Phosphinothricin N-acetyltransferase n=1 Tax=Planotetraspora kaengkrachanensis TaxID=575193 RepID=A0A8J3PVP9_9ACTN|nr:GNAT family N-acetyltransferase [Planotetraspora kaengkrachanensis]GIG81954.1 phosphinothricin N-acetyltransferase [Planotetraspora kaengkrachanensis]
MQGDRAASSSPAHIRPAGAGDLDAVAAIFAHYVADTVATFEETPPTPSDWRGRLDDLTDRRLPFLVGEVEGQVVGYAYAGPWRPKPAYRHTVEDSIYLAPGWTGRGLGRALLGALLEECEKADVRQVVAVIADTGDPTSAGLHRAFGFSDVGRLKEVGRKHGRWIDTLLLQRDVTG